MKKKKFRQLIPITAANLQPRFWTRLIFEEWFQKKAAGERTYCFDLTLYPSAVPCTAVFLGQLSIKVNFPDRRAPDVETNLARQVAKSAVKWCAHKVLFLQLTQCQLFVSNASHYSKLNCSELIIFKESGKTICMASVKRKRLIVNKLMLIFYVLCYLWFLPSLR